eukprot:c12683_g1_i1 orf=608-985(-)
MDRLQLLLRLSILITAIGLGIHAAGNFSASCNGLSVNQAGVLQATCENTNHISVSSTLDLNPHIINNNGHLQAGGGGFANSCNNIHLGGATLEASCAQTDGSRIQNFFDLNTNVANNNGKLQWVG